MQLLPISIIISVLLALPKAIIPRRLAQICTKVFNKELELTQCSLLKLYKADYVVLVV
ncbi:hypothetical protein [Zunongwangia pacifica]|uniref:Uncharacterized protein n=1 Tax=Zunongwangia pacifica TaxID=2911062 RepID=A0A9X1ZSU5_9FLAO|nr:hypothetical protein [Zunongwangia pacifica]MCL6217828.1 hypothetical protein [Zunongwangia pacifica]